MGAFPDAGGHRFHKHACGARCSSASSRRGSRHQDALDDDACGAIVRRCADAGVVVGRNASTVPGLGNVLILAPPFVIEEHECARVAETLRAALDA